MRNFTIANFKKVKNLTLIVFLLSFTLGAVAQTGTTAKSNELEVLAHYYPDPSFANSSSVKVLWGYDLDQDFFDFEDGLIPSRWINDDTYPWVVTTPNTDSIGWNGTYCMKSGNAGVANSTSSIQATAYFKQSGSINFIAGCFGEGENFDVCEFYIDGVLEFKGGELNYSDTCSFPVTQGLHTFKWSYTKDGSQNSTYDGFYIDDVAFIGVRGAKAQISEYYVYRTAFDAATGGVSGDLDTLAYLVDQKQYIDTTWKDLPVGDYRYGVEILWSTAQMIYWSNVITKPEIQYFDITVSADPSNAGTVTGGGTYAERETCTLTATANFGYYFSYWTSNDSLVEGVYDTVYSFPVTEAANIVAHFAPKYYDYDVYVEPEGAGEADVVFDDEQNWSIYFGDTITLQAVPNDGFSFVSWTAYGFQSVKGGRDRGTVFISNDANCTKVIDEDFLRGVFDDVDVEEGSDGTMIVFVATFEEGIGDCKRPKKFTNTEVGPDFATFKWTESGIAESWYIYYHEVAPAATEDLYVEVTENPYTLWGLQPDTPYEAYVVPACGIEDSVPNSIVCSSVISFTTMGPCPSPLHVEVSGVTGTTATVTWMDYSESYLVQVGIPDLIMNENFDNGMPTDWSNDAQYPWTVVDGYIQSGNKGVDSSSSSISVTKTFNGNGVVEFDAECRGEGSGNSIWDRCEFSIDGQGYLYYGQDVEGWNHYSFDVSDGEHTFTWSYTKDNSMDPEGDYFAIDNIMMREGDIDWANPLPAEESQYTVTGLTPLTLYAVQVQGVCEDEETEWSAPVFFTTTDAYPITVSVNPAEAGTATGDGEYSYGDTCTLVASANTGFVFVNWTKNDTVVSTDATYSFTVTEVADFVANFEQIEYYLSLSSNPEVGGTVAFVDNNSQAFHYGDTVAIQATPALGYSFINWTVLGGNDDVELTTNPTYTFTIGDNNPVTTLYPQGGQISLLAHFEIQNFDITVTSNPVDGGTVQVNDSIFTGGTFTYGETLAMEAVANEGYTFQNWTKNDTVVSTETSISFEVVETAAYVANFELITYDITAMVSVNPAEGGTVNGAGTYTYGQTCTLTAIPAEGYHFVNWTKNGEVVSTSETLSFLVTEAASYVANFEINSYEIVATANPEEGGTITGVNTYNHFETCTLTATVNEGYTFVNWTKDGVEVSTSETLSFVVTEAAAYVANFELITYDITAMVTVNPAEGGTVNGAGTYTYGQTCTLTAIPAEGYHFVNWTKNGEVVSTSETLSFVVTEAASYVANFEINNYEITATTAPVAGGTVSGTGTFDHFATCTLTATPATGYHFVNWKEGTTVVSTSATYSFEVTGARTLVATFMLNSYAITATVNPASCGTVSGTGNYNHFATCTLTATPATGYHFVRWTLNGTEVGTEATYSFEVTGAASYVAHFEINNYEITTAVNPASGGTATGDGNYNHFETCTLTATANPGYQFVRWTKGTETVSTDEVYTFEVIESATYRAHFELVDYVISAEANPEEGGTITGTGNLFHYNTTCQLVAHVNTGYHFVNWTLDGTQVSTSYIYEFSVTGSAHYVANFELDTFEITATVDPEEAGTITGAGTYSYGQTVTLTAVANADFRFLNWTEGDEVVSEEATYTFDADSDRQLVAHFLNTVGIAEHEALTVTLYPNPVQDKLIVRASEPVKTFEIFSINGVLVDRQSNCSDKIEINVEHYAHGTYMIRLTTDSAVEIRRFVKE